MLLIFKQKNTIIEYLHEKIVYLIFIENTMNKYGIVKYKISVRIFIVFE